MARIMSLTILALAVMMPLAAYVNKEELEGKPACVDMLDGVVIGADDVTVTDQPFVKASRVVVESKKENVWGQQITGKITAPMEKGDTMLLVFYMRTISADNPKGIGTVTVKYEQAGPPWGNAFTAEQKAGKEWTRIALPFTAKMPFPKGGAQMCFQLGGQKQTVEIGGVMFVNFGNKVTPAALEKQADDVPVDISQFANMDFKDDVAGDGRGGWSDQGAENDLSGFDVTKKDYNGIQFNIIDPAKNNGKAVVTFKSKNISPAVTADALNITMKDGTRGTYLYLLHTICWAGKYNDPVGTIAIRLRNGKTVTQTVTTGKDVSDWWKPANLDNGIVVYKKPNKSETVGVYLSKFRIDNRAQDIASMTMTTAGNAIWIVAGATVSSKDIDFTVPHFIAMNGKEWKTVDMSDIRVKSGSALDFSSLGENVPAGAYGRIVLNDKGQFVCEKRPDKRMVFMSASIDGGVVPRLGAEPTTKKDIADWAKLVRLQGYTMARPHFLDHYIMEGAKADCDFNPERLDNYFYMVHCLKQNGVYLYFDAMTSWGGYVKGSGWGAADIDLKTRMYFDETARKNWMDGVKKLMTTVNPYTKTALVDDPQVAVLLFHNEQEINNLSTKAAHLWRAWLKERYKTVDALKTAWTDKDGKCWLDTGMTIDNAPLKAYEKSPRGADAGRWRASLDSMMYDWFLAEIRKIGYTGLVTQYDCFKNLGYSAVRNAVPVISMHGYHSHPHGFDSKGSQVQQKSSIDDLGGWWRSMAGTRYGNRPFMITEYGHVFWNHYRYEEGFLIGGYSALQDYDCLMAHAGVVYVEVGRPISPFRCGADPISRASQVIATLLFARRDVTPSSHYVEVMLDDAYVFGSPQSNPWGGMNSEQSLLSLVSGFGISYKNTPIPDMLKSRAPDLVFAPSGASVVENTSYASRTLDSDDKSFSCKDTVAKMKSMNLVPQANRTDPEKGLFESDNGELFMDKSKKEIRVAASRFEGGAMLANAAASFKQFAVETSSVDAAVAIASLDNKDVASSKRLLLIYSTDALNSGMEFNSEERVTLEKNGKPPVLMATGTLKVSLKNMNAASLKVYALGLDGSRKEPVTASVNGGVLKLVIDTSALKNGPTPFFEIAAE
ncbi:MAG: beta-galactosidase [Spirochaetes bacterium]|nr:beta-galactosidase [Spirochaetota bacterium]